MSELVSKLTEGMHAIAAERCKTAAELQEQIKREFLLLKFTETQGGTELGSQLDMSQTSVENANFEKATGSVHIVGNLSLDYKKVQLVADIELSTLKGKGQLVLQEEAVS